MGLRLFTSAISLVSVVWFVVDLKVTLQKEHKMEACSMQFASRVYPVDMFHPGNSSELSSARSLYPGRISEEDWERIMAADVAHSYSGEVEATGQAESALCQDPAPYQGPHVEYDGLFTAEQHTDIFN